MTHTRSSYDLLPTIPVSSNNTDCAVGWSEIELLLRDESSLLVVELYPGCDAQAIESGLAAHLGFQEVIRAAEALLPSHAIEARFATALGTDPVFAVMGEWTLGDYFDPEKLEALRARLAGRSGHTLVIGTGASLIAGEEGTLVYADLARWEIQKRQRAHVIGNFGLENADASPAVLYKRAFFADWRAADRLKLQLLDKLHFLLDTNKEVEPKLITGERFRKALKQAASGPFRVVPFFDAGPWGGQWMKENFGLPDGPPNYAWCFDCVPEENSLLLGFGSRRVEVPALDLVFFQSQQLLGKKVFEMFGPEFPIRFDYLDTMHGGNLSLQVHPLREYIREHFGMSYTQDESYYMFEAADDGIVYLGLQDGIDRSAMERDLRTAQINAAEPFPAEEYVNIFPARKHDHFLIPAGTIHCSGRNGVVLEISATPYIFTFKLWDWGRLGLDGKPRPIHLDHGLKNIQWDRTTNWVKENLVNQFVEVSRGDCFVEERTGLHELEFIETRRHWFTGPVHHDTQGTVNVLNLVEGDSAIVESPIGAFKAYTVTYGETFIVPAQVGAYTVRPAHHADKPLATMKAFVRGTEA